MDKLVGH